MRWLCHLGLVPVVPARVPAYSSVRWSNHGDLAQFLAAAGRIEVMRVDGRECSAIGIVYRNEVQRAKRTL